MQTVELCKGLERVKNKKKYSQRQSPAKYIGNLLGLTIKILILRESLTLLFGYFGQDNCKTESLPIRLGTML